MICKSRFTAAALLAVVFVLAPMPALFASRANAQVVKSQANARVSESRANARILRTSDSGVDFTLRDLNGHETRLSQYRGHPVVLDFWATWCGPCRRQIPELKKLYTKYHSSRGLVVLGIACDTVQGDGVQVVAPFVRQFNINYPILLAEAPVLDSFGVEALPTTLFLGTDGSIVGRILGSGGSDELGQGVTALLANPSGKSRPAKKLTPEEQKKANSYDIEYRQ
jgi:thiol-disulfide isomerase/thioredoxin